MGHTPAPGLASKPVLLSKLNICLVRDQGWSCISGRLGTGLASRDAVTRPHVDTTLYRVINTNWRSLKWRNVSLIEVLEVSDLVD